MVRAKEKRHGGGRALVAAAALGATGLAAFPEGALAIELFDVERELADELLAKKESGWAVLPIIGFSPESEGKGGLKLSAHGLPPSDLSLDLEGTFAVAGQQGAEIGLRLPRVFGKEYLVAMLQAEYRVDPRKEFFGLGDTDVGPDEIATNEMQDRIALLTFGGSPVDRLTLALTVGYRQVDIRRGDLDDGVPSTRTAFPSLVGVQGGGKSSPVSVSATYNNRVDPARPTRGWVTMFKISHVPDALGNDFEFTRYAGDLSYLFPLGTQRQVIGLRLQGELIDAGRGDVPFYELATLGGSDDLRGYFADRFLGTASIVGNAEYRLKLFDFDFFDIWHVQIDGVGFGDVGRVFMDSQKLARQSRCPEPGGALPLPVGGETTECRPLPEKEEELRVSYGGGVRIALGEALVARIDVGFSPEDSGLVYLTFGQTF